MAKLTLKQTYELCTELWTWLSENPRKLKQEWPRWEEFCWVKNGCFACEYASQHEDELTDYCKFCPLQDLWGQGCDTDPSSPYLKWQETSDDTERVKYAKEIADYCLDKLREVDTTQLADGKA